MKYTYQGGRAHLDVKLPNGRWLCVARGDTVEVNTAEAKALADLPGWSKKASQSTTTESLED